MYCTYFSFLLLSISFFPSLAYTERLLLLDGDEGSVACRIYDHELSGTVPRLSDNLVLESATRSLLRMQNLTAVRGVPGSSMVGPIDYFGNLEEPHKYVYTIQMGYPPLFQRQPVEQSVGDEQLLQKLKPIDARVITTITVNWIRGKENEQIKEKERHYNLEKRHLRQSLFLHPGLLEVEQPHIDLKYFDARGVDLSSFKARLVDNSTPFQITKKALPTKDDYRLITYLYEPFYADWQVQHASGLFLEKHLFSQTITPLTQDSRGFVCLARTNEKPDELELIAIQIPYGFTLIIDEECIHGDTTLIGFFMMGMTSDHKTMRSADTVFLKYPGTKANVHMLLLDDPAGYANDPIAMPLAPYVIYKGATPQEREKFKQRTRRKNFIFSPFSREYWR